MNRNRFIVVFDYETDGKSSDTCNITEIAAIPIDLRNLNIITDEIFEMVVCPAELKNKNYYELHEPTINWHADQRSITPEEVYESWKSGIPEKEAWNAFYDYIGEYAKGTKWDTMAIPGGQNIRGFDLPISARYEEKYKRKLKFNKRDIFDLMDLARPWLIFSKDAPDSISMDALRKFFGVDSYGAHTAKKDVLDTAHFITKFLGLHERIAPNVRWNSGVSA